MVVRNAAAVPVSGIRVSSALWAPNRVHTRRSTSTDAASRSRASSSASAVSCRNPRRDFSRRTAAHETPAIAIATTASAGRASQGDMTLPEQSQRHALFRCVGYRFQPRTVDPALTQQLLDLDCRKRVAEVVSLAGEAPEAQQPGHL